jgi:type IV secretory pathway VirB2 component (pilin)
MIKRYLTTIGVAGAAAFSQISRAFAQIKEPPTIEGLNPETDITNVILDIITIILDVILIIAVLYVIIAGIRLIVSGGDEGQKDTAKKTIIYVVAGIIVILFARAIVTFINSSFGGGA